MDESVPNRSGGGAPKGGAPKGGAPKDGEPKISRFFTMFFLSSLSWGSFRGILVVFLKAGTMKCARLGSGPPGFHTTARELQTCTFEGPGASNTTKIPREDPQRKREERKKLVAGEGKKRAKFWAVRRRGGPAEGVLVGVVRVGAVRVWGPEGWGPEGWGPEGWGPEGWGPEG